MWRQFAVECPESPPHFCAKTITYRHHEPDDERSTCSSIFQFRIEDNQYNLNFGQVKFEDALLPKTPIKWRIQSVAVNRVTQLCAYATRLCAMGRHVYWLQHLY